MSKRKIALISDHASPLAVAGGTDSGGQNVYVAHVARELARAGHDVDVFTRREEPSVSEIVEKDGYRVIHVPAGLATVLPKEELLRYMGEFAAYLLHFARREAEHRPYDLLHANFFMSGLVGLIVKRQLGIPLVVTFHALGKVRRMYQGDADRFPDARFEIEDELMREADRIIAECEQDSHHIANLYESDASRVDVVPCGFDPGEFAPLERRSARALLGWDPDAFIVLQLGRLVPRKGVDNVIRAIGALRHRLGKEAKLYVVGGNSEEPDEKATPEIARLKGVASAERVEDLVVFAGRRGREVLRYYYAASDVFVTTPWYEPFGITPVEAMACARPVIGAAVGGIRSTVVDGVTGYLVPPNEPDAVATRISHLMTNPALAERLGLAGRARASSLYTWSGVTRRIAAVYERTLTRERAAGRRHEYVRDARLPASSRMAR